MVNQFIETWRINNRVNLMLLDGISDGGLNLSLSKQRIGTAAKQFAHLHNIRFDKLKKLAVNLGEEQEKLYLESKITRDILRYELIKSSEAIEKVLRRGFENEGELKGYRRGVITFMGYLISYESHRRSNIMLMLKQNGYKLPKSISYDIWDWNKL
ncbi:MAG TPA: hypothetical protein VJ964_08095 [Balneolaceae bacterium]|nr:hypothetical protein [Balneolaceae bacterium]